jgi:hypothetical protein
MGVFYGNRFDILSLSPALWLDASDSSTLFDATTGGNLVTMNNSVARWEDKSGNSRHVTQALLSRRPTRRLLSGNNVLRFSEQFMVNDEGLGARSGHSLFAVSLLASNYQINKTFIMSEWNTGASVGTNEWNLSYGGGTGQGRPRYTIAINSISIGVGFDYQVINKLNILSARHDSINVELSIATDTGRDAVSSVATGTIDQVAGRQFYVGALHVNGSPQNVAFMGDIAELIVFPTALSTSQRQAVEKYLANKYAIPLTS